MKRRDYHEYRRPSKRRKTVRSIRRDRISRFITVPLYLFVMFFFLVPGLLVILEMSGRLAMETKILGGISLVAGSGLASLLFIYVISFRKEDLALMKTLVILFLIYYLFIGFGNLVSDNTLSFRQVLRRYNSSFKSYIKTFENGAGKSRQSTADVYLHISVDSIVKVISDQICVDEFFLYASEKYYQDLDSWFLYLGVNEIMSVYHVMLEEFEVTENTSDAVDPYDVEMIIESRAGSQAQLTLLFTACLSNFDQRVEVIETTNGNLINMVRISPGYYPHLQNFIHSKNLNHVLIWYMQEHMVRSVSGIYHWVPLYIPVNSTDPPAPYGKLCRLVNPGLLPGFNPEGAYPAP